jgi:hypothetical protein
MLADMKKYNFSGLPTIEHKSYPTASVAGLKAVLRTLLLRSKVILRHRRATPSAGAPITNYYY